MKWSFPLHIFKLFFLEGPICLEYVQCFSVVVLGDRI